MALKYVAYVDIESGRVVRCMLPQYNVPVNGDIVDEGKHKAVHLSTETMPDISMAEFVETYWYDMVSDEFVHIGTPPNKFAVWDKESEGWTWDPELVLNQVRQQRDLLLKQTDWTQLPDSPLSDEMKSAWQEYRQTLRDITDGLNNPSSVEDVDWPPLP